MSAWSSTRIAARLARREVTKRPWRTALVALLVALPVGGMIAAAAFVRTGHDTPETIWRRSWGTADAVREGALPMNDLDATTAELPEGSTVVTFRREWRVLATGAGERTRTEVSTYPASHPILDGTIQVTSGRLPNASDEVFLSRATARDLGVDAGDVLDLTRPTEATWDVVGVGERASWWESEFAIVANGTRFPWGELSGAVPGAGAGSSLVRVVDLPASLSVAELDTLGQSTDGLGYQLAPSLGTPQWWTDETSDTEVRWSWVIGAVVLTVVGIVIASAFAAGARRQLTTLGQLAANGAPPTTLKRVLFLQGTWTGILGSTLGLALGAAILAALAPHLDTLLDKDVDPYTIHAVDIVPPILLGVAAATVAALIPARSNSRIPVLTALAGRRPLGSVPRWLPTSGAAAIAVGLALLGLAVIGGRDGNGNGAVWALTAIVGGVTVLLGACAVAPAYVSFLDPAAARLRGAWRLAARSLARQRTRTAGVVSAIAATAALAIAASALVLSARAGADVPPWIPEDEIHLESWTSHVEGDAEVVPDRSRREIAKEVAGALPGSEVIVVQRARQESSPRFWQVEDMRADTSGPPPQGDMFAYGSEQIAIADDETLRAYPLSRSEQRLLAKTGAVLLADRTGDATLVLTNPQGVPPADDPPRLDAAVINAYRRPLGVLPRLLFTPATAEALGLVPVDGTVVVRTPGPLTREQRIAVAKLNEDLQEEMADLSGGMTGVNLSWHDPSGEIDPLLVEAVLAGVALVFCLFVVAVSLGLAAAETRDERDVLAVVGAPPAALRRTSGNKALLLTVLGAVLAVPVGFLPVAVFHIADAEPTPLVFPWRIVALLLVVVPIATAAITTAASGFAGRVRPVRVSTMAFD